MKHLSYNEYIIAKKIIKSLCEDTDIIAYAKGISGIDEYDIKRQISSMPESNYYQGMTKGVVHNTELLPGWVIKFDIHKPILYRDQVYSYCELEYHFYREAVHTGFDKYLATDKYICSIDNIKFYLMEYVYCDENEIESLWLENALESGEYEDSNEAYESIRDYDTYDTLMCTYGDANFASWAYSKGITDLHSGNFGYTSDNTLLIIDFSGFGYKEAR